MNAMRWALLLLVPLLAQAADVRQDYRRQWPLQVTGSDAGLYQLTLDAAVYRIAHDAALRDVTVIDARGQELPTAWLPMDAAPAAAVRRQRLPLFALPAGAAPANGDLQLIAERDASGAVRRLEGRFATGAVAAGRGVSWLIDASALRDRPRALVLDWEGDMPVQAQVRVEGSDDLRDWRVLASNAMVMALDNQAQRLQQRRIALDDGARYLRLVTASGALPALRVVEAELEGIAMSTPPQWLDLPGTTQDAALVYALPGRFPISQLDVGGSQAEAVEWIVASRDSDDAPWLQRAGPWLAYRLGQGAAAASPPQLLSAPVRDRQWRLVAAQGRSTAVPTLRVGYRPERLMFLAQGQPPYALVAGSARAQRTDAPLGAMLQALRRERGAQWQPAQASLAAQAQPLAGDAALQAAATPRDWKRWLLWGLLVGGALLVGGFAVSLLRSASANRNG
ncbi:DUF3999 domain-containing protein [Xanthomonas phaseoli]|uniref:DUF3999 domain-containing protein n=1 Tax=Xanthomonas phaseoli TaxID=1985254 RepID=UPI001237F37B|nr:DUF3999 domain-containing protein [Xanthomonas phaseoli]MBO9830926.1 DUF3999 domain-containing protein [Xanthomonas phaseoli pv. dieffenbachiae]MBO9837834.1 DUF3999 domain-containing protein [Xanthomonas phaseoli pv. dieffenbachiae]MBO9841286.1 DUF3999 domain-containing protein [Xanthomonas phaseoli pv. dieffenbachiae]MBO9862322.1 DUF3999 domain-containing protein [Xanthomonas phaseoli pv. dieffenbachiae]MBO9866080.1 DUF3999 domain-containing protein [Xanthomonas phaseoli pv. dieffenbachiae